jgi:phage shock protein PspC (stress-responsive transcriptional regulator)
MRKHIRQTPEVKNQGADQGCARCGSGLREGTLVAMTSTDTIGAVPPAPPPPAAPGRRLLRRSRTDRVGAGVAGGLGEYFGLDPVLFRVLFATSAFFGGAGILAYLLAWIAIPEAGTEHATIDRWIHQMRRRRVPFWTVAILGTILFWAVAFSWWAPGPIFPVMIVLVVLIGIFMRRSAVEAAPPAEPVEPAEPAVSLTKDSDPGRPQWVSDTRQWVAESREAHRVRRSRAMPIRVATLATLLLTLIVLGLIDAASGIWLPVYFYVSLGILGAGFCIGLVLRRTPWSVVPLLAPAIAGTVVFGGSHASLHDGVGQREWKPTSTVSSDYRLAFGEGVLDLRSLSSPTAPQTVHVTMAGGQVKVIASKTMNVVVQANLRFGRIVVDGSDEGETRRGVGLSDTIDAPTGATGPQLTIDVHLAAGQVTVDHR